MSTPLGVGLRGSWRSVRAMAFRAGAPPIFAAALLALAPGVASAAPDLQKPRRCAGLTVYPDHLQRRLFYYAPGDLAVAQGPQGQPKLQLVHARYIGTSAGGDQGSLILRSVLSFRVVVKGALLADLKAARVRLKSESRSEVELRPLPIRRLDAALVYAPPGSDEVRALPEGRFEASTTGDGGAVEEKVNGTPAETRQGSEKVHWSQRVYTLGLAPAEAQILSLALERGRVGLSVAFAFYAEGIGPGDSSPDAESELNPAAFAKVAGSGTLFTLLRQGSRGRASRRSASNPDSTVTTPHLVHAGALTIVADIKKWPGLVRRIDLNQGMPPGYAALEVYCYDFNNALRPDLYEKQVEIEAEAVGGGTVRLAAFFRRSQPDVFAHSLRFAVAVRLDRPYRYRVREVQPDGRSVESAWQEQPSWAGILDVTALAPSPATSPGPKDPNPLPSSAGGRS